MAKRKKNGARSLITAGILAVGLGLLISFGVLQQQGVRSQANSGGSDSFTPVEVVLYLDGIGAAGDAANPVYSANMQPKRTQRQVTVTFVRTDDGFLNVTDGTVKYDSQDGNFKGEVQVRDLTPGTYTVRAAIPFYIEGRELFPVEVIGGQSPAVPGITLKPGDANNDSKLDVTDYTLIMDCLELNLAAKNCDAQKKTGTDLDDDGKVTQYDYNLFLREIAGVLVSQLDADPTE